MVPQLPEALKTGLSKKGSIGVIGIMEKKMEITI